MNFRIPFFRHYLHDVEIAFESITGNKLKSFLTTLGIIFGVAAVISMMAIGRGAKQEIMDQIKMVGVNNIVIAPLDPEKQREEESEAGEGERNERGAQKFSPGLSLMDALAIRKVLPHALYVSPEAISSGTLSASGVSRSGKMVGVNADYFQIFNLSLASGTLFTEIHQNEKMAVCVIGHNIRAKFFNKVPAIGSYIKFNDVWLKVIGVLQRVGAKSEYNDQIFIPINSFTLRYKARSGGSVFRASGGRRMIVVNPSVETPPHELSRIVVQMEESTQLPAAQNVLSRMMLRRHQGVTDVEVTVPELLLKQQQRSNDIFNIVLGAIAGISLLVGGIGIMNIMFASVMERTKEIGIRLAIGAKKVDVIAQFLAEAILISVTGGLIGVFLGVSLSFLIERMFDIQTMVSLWSILLSFLVSVAVGVVFGFAPARRASLRDPIESLRYE